MRLGKPKSSRIIVSGGDGSYDNRLVSAVWMQFVNTLALKIWESDDTRSTAWRMRTESCLWFMFLVPKFGDFLFIGMSLTEANELTAPKGYLKECRPSQFADDLSQWKFRAVLRLVGQSPNDGGALGGGCRRLTDFSRVVSWGYP